MIEKIGQIQASNVKKIMFKIKEIELKFYLSEKFFVFRNE